MLVIQPNLERMSEEDLEITIEKYELAYKASAKATLNNKLVRL